jgi:hypothetical protein
MPQLLRIVTRGSTRVAANHTGLGSCRDSDRSDATSNVWSARHSNSYRLPEVRQRELLPGFLPIVSGYPRSWNVRETPPPDVHPTVETDCWLNAFRTLSRQLLLGDGAVR